MSETSDSDVETAEYAAYARGDIAAARRDGGRIIVEHHFEGVLADGGARSATVADVLLLRGGQVVHMQAYADPADVPN